MYVAVDSTIKLRKTYEKAVYKSMVVNKEKQALKSYNEFEL
jgi:hypothetical protein